MKTKKVLIGLSFAIIAIITFNSCKNEQKQNTDEVAINENVGANNIKSTSETVAIGYKIGDEATDFKLKDVNGKMVSLSYYKDAKGYIVIFTCNTCPFAVASEERIVALDKEFKPKGYTVIDINTNNQEVKEDDSCEI